MDAAILYILVYFSKYLFKYHKDNKRICQQYYLGVVKISIDKCNGLLQHGANHTKLNL